jgi:hypothetical protein
MENKQNRHVRTTSMDEKALGDELDLELALMDAESPENDTTPKREDSSSMGGDSSPKKEESSPQKAVTFTVPETLPAEAITLQKAQENPSPALADGKSSKFLQFL